MQQKRVLENTTYYVKEDYPQHILEKRKILQEQVKIEMDKGNKAFIKYDKLIILKNDKTETESTDSRKRNLSISPQHDTHSEENVTRNTQVTKKNKTLRTHTTPQRSSSFSEGLVKPGILNFLVNKNSVNAEEENKKNKNNVV